MLQKPAKRVSLNFWLNTNLHMCCMKIYEAKQKTTSKKIINAADP